MDYVSKIILSVLKEQNVANVDEMEKELKRNETKLDGLFYLFKLDKTLRRKFALKIGVEENELEATLNVLRAI
jgi:hypothetical protein